MTDEEFYEWHGETYPFSRCVQCIWRGDGEEVCDDTWCWEHECTIKMEWGCPEFRPNEKYAEKD